MSEAWKGGSTRAWTKQRRRVLDQNQIVNGGRCALAIAGVCTIWAKQVHHVKGRAVTGDDPRWLAATCAACNAHIGDPQAHPASCYCGYGYDRGPQPPRPRRVSRW